MTLRLTWDETSHNKAFHAAMVTLEPTRRPLALHTHDFAEFMLMVEGTALHHVNGACDALQPGDVLYVRPADCHAVTSSSGPCRFINVAFPTETWRNFTSLAGLQEVRHGWDSAAAPPRLHLSGASRTSAALTFRHALEAFAGQPSRLDLCRFFTDLLPRLLDVPSPVSGPPWLHHACACMQSPAHLRGGVPEFVRLCGVSSAHLSRTLRALLGVTPTHYVNELRLRHAAVLLSTTPRPILDVALECGFDNLSHFYHGFKTMFGDPPHRYRLRTARQIMPGFHDPR